MKIGIFTYFAPEDSGRIKTQASYLKPELQARGVEVAWASKNFPPLRRALDMELTLVKCRADINIIELYSGNNFYIGETLGRTSKLLGKPYVLWAHGGNLPAFTQKIGAKRMARLLKGAAAVVAPSSYLGSWAQGLDTHPVIINNMVPPADIPYRKRETFAPKLMWMRTFHPTWNPEMAIRTVKLLAQKYPSVSLTMAGADKGGLADTKALAAELGLSQNIHFAGFLDAEGKRKAFDASDIYINTNRIDNTPVATIEAASAGLALVSTEVGGIPYMYRDGETAMLVPTEDPAAMSAAIGRIIETPGLGQKITGNARNFAQQCTPAAVTSRWIELLNTLQAKRR